MQAGRQAQTDTGAWGGGGAGGQQPVHAFTHTHPVIRSSRQATQALPSSQVGMDVGSCLVGGQKAKAFPTKPQHECCNAQQQQQQQQQEKNQKEEKREEEEKKEEMWSQTTAAHLLSLLDERLPEQLPGDVLHNAVGLLQTLVDGDRAHWNRSVAHDELTRLVDVCAG